MTRVLWISVCLCVCFAVQTFAQSSNARLSGTVNDTTGAVLPGVEVKATNNATGVVTTALSNEAGAYNFASLLPGSYTISASLPAFQTQTFNNIQLGNAAQVRLNFSLQVGQVATNVEVSVTSNQLLLETSSSVGNVLEEKKVVDLPLVSNNVLDLVGVMAGVNVTKDNVFGANDTKFAGVAAGNINVQRDGIPITGGRWPTGLQPATTINPDLVGEVRMILAPVDAELGRGSGQFQIQTRSGTNEFHGGVVWDAQNSALDAHSWSDNQTGATPLWRNQPEMTARIGGPIIKNKTFFFGLFDKQWALIREAYTALSLTPCAQRGIYRYFSGWAPTYGGGPLNAAPTWSQPTNTGGAFPTTPWVNQAGVPRSDLGPIQYASVFGPDLSFTGGAPNADCSNAVVSGGPRDPNRTQIDPTGYVNTLFKYMPPVNNFNIGDGLNVAGHRWTRTRDGGENLFAVGEPVNWKQWNAKIDHIFNQQHKISGAWSFEKDYASDAFMTWPNTWEGKDYNQPQVLTVNFVSTLSPRLVNEARFGMNRTGTNEYAPLYNPAFHDEIFKLFPKNGNGLEFPPLLGYGQANFHTDQPIGTRGFEPLQLLNDSTPRKTWADTVSLTMGKHAFRLGGEYRHGSSKSTVSSSGSAVSPCASSFQGGFAGNPTNPIAQGGVTPLSPVQGIAGTAGLVGVPGSAAIPGAGFLPTFGSIQGMENLLTFLSGSLCGVSQYRFINNASQAGVAWNDPTKDTAKIRDFHQNEIGVFFKDDWKFSNRMTLNLGLRWDYYGVPYEKNGLAGTLAGGGAALFGISGRSFDGWMSPGARADASQIIFVGPNSPNSGLRPYPRDLNNFGPAVGFAWNATSNTVVRGGYQIQYVGGGNFNGIEGALGQTPGSEYLVTYQGDSARPYLDLTSITKNQIPYPIAPPVLPVQQILLTDRTKTISAYDPNYVNPYVQNLTLSITKDVNRHLTLDARYIGTLTRKNFGSFDLNYPNFRTNGLKEAFDLARAGKDSPLLDQMFKGINIAGAGFGPVGTPFNGVPQTGALHLRNNTVLRSNLANGNYAALAGQIAQLNYVTFAGSGNESLPPVAAGVNGAVLRSNGFPENFILTNPQFGCSIGCTSGGATLLTNLGHSNYHSLQVLQTLRNIAGFNFQTSYTWSKELGIDPNSVPNGIAAAGFTDPTNQHGDYTLLRTNRTHVVRTYGSYDLPVGPGKSLAGNSHGVLARVIEGWQMSWIVNLQSGAPLTIAAQNAGIYRLGVPDQVRPFDFKGARGVQWANGNTGLYFGDIFNKVRDPQCLAIDPSISSFCTLQAVADKSGNIILQNPQPGTRGNVGLNSIEGAGTWTADMALTKSFKIRESLRGTVRMDARNVFNHPTPGANAAAFAVPPIDGGAQMNLNDTNPFGNIPLKGASPGYWAPSQRNFQLKVRLDF
ncbi:MAG TPA: TonB-dependent receptor [Terriglobia bacterium]|nr:TonB-dependent receptor [Terriglobia bacterium]